MVDPKQRQVSVRRQCELLGVSRSGLYYEPEQESARRVLPIDDERVDLRRIETLPLDG